MARTKDDTLERNFQAAGFDIQHRRIAKYVELCRRMQDLPRHLGQHSGGMVICGGQLNAVVPIEPASMPGRTVIQWDKEDCADMKIIKVDLLGLGMMAVLKDCLELVPHHYHEPLDLAQLPQNDPPTYRALQRADTVGMFQVESRAQMSALPRNHPTCFYDLVVQVAIIRPGPIVGNMMNPYMKRRRGMEKVSYYHPLLEPVLKRTLGIPLFQEQLIRMAMIVANFSGGEAEELRRAVGMRRSMARMKELDGQAAARHDRQWHSAQGAGRDRSIHLVLRALRISGVARRQLCADCLRQRLSQVQLSCGFYRRSAEQSADGLLLARDDCEGCATARPAREARRCAAFRLALHAGA